MEGWEWDPPAGIAVLDSETVEVGSEEGGEMAGGLEEGIEVF